MRKTVAGRFANVCKVSNCRGKSDSYNIKNRSQKIRTEESLEIDYNEVVDWFKSNLKAHTQLLTQSSINKLWKNSTNHEDAYLITKSIRQKRPDSKLKTRHNSIQPKRIELNFEISSNMKSNFRINSTKWGTVGSKATKSEQLINEMKLYQSCSKVENKIERTFSDIRQRKTLSGVSRESLKQSDYDNIIVNKKMTSRDHTYHKWRKPPISTETKATPLFIGVTPQSMSRVLITQKAILDVKSMYKIQSTKLKKDLSSAGYSAYKGDNSSIITTTNNSLNVNANMNNLIPHGHDYNVYHNMYTYNQSLQGSLRCIGQSNLHATLQKSVKASHFINHQTHSSKIITAKKLQSSLKIDESTDGDYLRMIEEREKICCTLVNKYTKAISKYDEALGVFYLKYPEYKSHYQKLLHNWERAMSKVVKPELINFTDEWLRSPGQLWNRQKVKSVLRNTFLNDGSNLWNMAISNGFEAYKRAQFKEHLSTKGIGNFSKDFIRNKNKTNQAKGLVYSTTTAGDLNSSNNMNIQSWGKKERIGGNLRNNSPLRIRKRKTQDNILGENSLKFIEQSFEAENIVNDGPSCSDTTKPDIWIIHFEGVLGYPYACLNERPEYSVLRKSKVCINDRGVGDTNQMSQQAWSSDFWLSSGYTTFIKNLSELCRVIIVLPAQNRKYKVLGKKIYEENREHVTAIYSCPTKEGVSVDYRNIYRCFKPLHGSQGNLPDNINHDSKIIHLWALSFDHHFITGRHPGDHRQWMKIPTEYLLDSTSKLLHDSQDNWTFLFWPDLRNVTVKQSNPDDNQLFSMVNFNHDSMLNRIKKCLMNPRNEPQGIKPLLPGEYESIIWEFERLAFTQLNTLFKAQNKDKGRSDYYKLLKNNVGSTTESLRNKIFTPSNQIALREDLYSGWVSLLENNRKNIASLSSHTLCEGIFECQVEMFSKLNEFCKIAVLKSKSFQFWIKNSNKFGFIS